MSSTQGWPQTAPRAAWGDTEAQSSSLGCPWSHHSSLEKTRALKEPTGPGVAPGAGRASSGLDRTPEDAAPEPPRCPPEFPPTFRLFFLPEVALCRAAGRGGHWL